VKLFGNEWRLKAMKNVLSLIALFAAAMLLPACAVAPSGTSVPSVTSPLPAQVSPLPQTPMSETEAANAPPARAAKAALAKQLSVDEANIRVLSVEEVEWSDGCLGLGRPEESCLQAIVPGFRVLLEVNGRQYEARTDRDAQQARVAPDTAASSAPAHSPAVQAAVTALAKQLNIDAQSINVVSMEEVEWPDGCLGLAKPDQMCTQAIVPGYRVMLEVNGKQYEARTSLNARQAVIAPQP
jgi:hypothetical protein